jgi:2-polyprenyl-3-methyl-5-hydroxy-6-metoxy-1,4-benzoquinol methylase
MGLDRETKSSEFDQFSENYRELHDRNISITGEKSEYFAAYKARFVAARVASKSDCRILDYGCGIGQVCSQLKHFISNARIDGYDISRESLDQIESDLRAQGTFTCETSELGRDYDVVIVANVLHHVKPKERQATVSRLVELLGATGTLMIFEHNPANPLTRRAVASCPFDVDAILLAPRETLGYVSQTRLRDIRKEYIVFFPHALRWFRPLEKSLAWCPLGAQYVISGSKA